MPLKADENLHQSAIDAMVHAFRANVREIIDESLSLPPMAGTDAAALPGTLEWQREREWRQSGIPIPDDHRELLDGIAAKLGIDLPAWAMG